MTNTGKDNTGHCNSGDCNSGDCNSGDCNSDHYNSGDCNSGHCNSGHRNSGDCNSGHYNSGHRNSGHRNSGHYNSGDYNSGFFNTDEPTVRMFNRDTGKKRSEISIPYIKLPVTIWVTDSSMSDEEKKNNPKFFVAGGYLKKLSYKEAWAQAWKELSKETRQQFLDLPNFDAKIFEEITGINVSESEPQSCEGKVVTIDGKKYRLSLV